MYEFTFSLLSLFCCAPFKRNKVKHDAPSDLRTFQPPNSTLSVPLPYNTVPHSSSDSQSEDARALHHIFSSSSSVRGYQTAATTPAYIPTGRPSLDLDFSFGGTSSSPPKPQGRIEQIGNQIRQRLSESRLSKASSRRSKQEPGMQDTALHGIPDASRTKNHGDPPVATSQSSAGLSEILASGNASRGGYDSDAKSINSPVLSSHAGTVQVEKGFVKHTLEQLESHVQTLQVPQSSTRSPLRTANVKPSSGAHAKGHSSPFPASPKKTTLAEALQIGKDESPKDLLRRLSAGIADGSIKMPDTPELRAARLPSIREVDNEWRLLAPKRSSSLPREQKELQAKLQQLGETVTSMSKDNQPDSSEDTKRISLISELDPTLLDYIDRYSQRCSSDSVRRTSVDAERAVVIPKSPPHDLSHNDVPQSKAHSPMSDTDHESIHLFNMRISQRLASRSRIPVAFPTSSLHASTQSLMLGEELVNTQVTSYDPRRRPAPVMREHNRRPSDPQTRALFESALGSRDPSRSWKTVTPAPSTTSYAALHSTMPSRPDLSSSCYLSDNVPDEEEPNKKPGIRRSLNVNPHSLAIGGRSVSVNLSTSCSDRRTRHLSPADSGWSQQLSLDNPRSSGDSWEAPTRVYQRGRSASMPQKRSQREHVSPTPHPRRFRQPTRDAENLRGTSLQGVLDQRNEHLTEISVQALAIRRDAQFSEIDPTMSPAADGAISRRSGDGFLQEQNHSNQGILHLSESPAKPAVISDPDPKPLLKECATDVWEGAFRQTGGKLTAPSRSLLGPPAAHSGRRRSFGSIGSVSAMDVMNRASIGSSRRSRSADEVGRSLKAGEGLHPRQSVRVSFPTALPDISATNEEDSKQRSKNLEPRQRKKSILDLRRHFTGGPSNSSDAASTPFKELMSIWSRFPSHNSAERNGSAGRGNNVATKDFVTSAEQDAVVMSPVARKGKIKSMTVREPLWRSPAGTARRRRKGILGKWKRIYRSSSTDLRKYAYNHGYRSSISLGDSLEYPELEYLPGERQLTETDVQRLHARLEATPGKADKQGEMELPVTDAKPRLRPEAVDWGKYYGDCVGSLSALKSESDLDVNSAVNIGAPADAKSLDMRESTVNFQEALGREQQQLKQQLLDQIGNFDSADAGQNSRGGKKRVSSATDNTTETVLASSIKTRDLQIPGSFD